MNYDNEVWKDVPGYDGRYSVSDYGRVRVNWGIRSPNYMKPFLAPPKPYLRVGLCDPITNKQIQRGIHQIVMWSFVGPQEPGMVVNHKDCDPTNNNLTNLEYVTPGENSRHAVANGRHAGKIGEYNSCAKLKLDMVFDIKYFIRDGASNVEVAQMYRVTPGAIQNIRSGKSWKYVPWERWSPEGERQLREQVNMPRIA